MIRSQKRKVSRQYSIQAPTSGLNARDPLAAMKETEAVTLDNFFPMPSEVVTRMGCEDYATGFSGDVETIMYYNNGVQQEIFGSSSGDIYDVTSGGEVTTPVVSGLDNSRLQHINFGTAGSHFLLAVNGADKMQVYNGSEWYNDGDVGKTSVTGFDTADAVHINNFKNRVWFIERDSMNAWFLPVASVGGAADNIDLAGIFRLGGYLMAMGNWTIDNAAGVDDYAAFITSEGEVALYRGTDPSNAATWALVGTFRMGRPIGRRCMCKAGADVLVMTTDGAFPLSKALLTDRSQLNLAATDKIQDLINRDARLYYNNFGWQPIIHPSGNKLIINVPQGNNSIQYVMNTNHGAWSRFTGWNAKCFEVVGNRLFYGMTGKVVEADIGYSDFGEKIPVKCQQAFSYFQSKGRQKLFKIARPVISSEGVIIPIIRMNVDFKLNESQLGDGVAIVSGADWDTAIWDEDTWSNLNVVSLEWQSIPAVGVSGGINISSFISGSGYSWISTDVVYEVGSPI